ncbi:MAG TPA: PKD domain-containing protein, partial [Chitinophagaceae bacterium]|nr:PKD domain-containing protein [Chitinophagaceae bacterium]
HVYTKTGTYRVELRVTNGNCSHVKAVNIQVLDEQPVLELDRDTLCKGSTVEARVTGVQRAHITRWQWTYGDGDTAAGPRPAPHRYRKAGVYPVTALLTDLLGCTYRVSRNVVVSGPEAGFVTSAPAACIGEPQIGFTDRSVADGRNAIIRRVWSFGDGQSDSLSPAPLAHLYAAPGTYAVTLAIQDAQGCTDTVTRSSAVVIADPRARFTAADTLSCAGTPVSFRNQSEGQGLTYRWTFGDGAHSVVRQPAHAFTQTGLYDVRLQVTDQYGCSDSLVRPAYITIGRPEARFTVSDSVGTCPPLFVRFRHTSKNYTKLLWIFGDGNTSEKEAPEHYYTAPGIYWAQLVVTGTGGCTDTALQRIEVRGPRGSFSYNARTGCTPVSVAFSARTAGNLSFVWDFADGTTLVTKDSVVQHTYSIPGAYLPRLILVDAGGCRVSVPGTDTIHVKEVTAAIEADSALYCNTATVRFRNRTTGNDQITGYRWSFGDGQISEEQVPVHTYTRPGLYPVQLTVFSENGCTDSLRLATPVRVWEGPAVTVSGPTEVCAPARVSWSGTVQRESAGLQWSWNLGNGQVSDTAGTTSSSYPAPGSYTAILIVRDTKGCADTAHASVQVRPVPVTSAGADTVVCRGNAYTLQATGAVRYQWKSHTDLSCTDCPQPVVRPSENGVFLVTGFNEWGCSATDSVRLNVRQPFRVTAGRGDTLCAGEGTRLQASGAELYRWFPATGVEQPDAAATRAQPRVTTLYTVVGRDRDGCFTDTAFVPVVVNPVPTVEAGTDLTVPAGGTVQLEAVSSPDVTAWQWQPAGSLSCADCPRPEAQPRSTTKYVVSVSNSGGCTAADAVTVSVICNGGNLFFPNTFSPNGDGRNERFYPRGSGVARVRSLRVFNRWGELVFERANFNANDASSGWDGTFKGKKLTSDVFMYTCEVICSNNEVLPFKGDITLLQ